MYISRVRKYFKKSVYYTDGTTAKLIMLFLARSLVHTCSLKFMTPVIVLWNVFTRRFFGLSVCGCVCVAVCVLNGVHFLCSLVLNSKIVPFLLHVQVLWSNFCNHNTYWCNHFWFFSFYGSLSFFTVLQCFLISTLLLVYSTFISINLNFLT